MKGVYLVGAGPGDRDLITVKGKQVIQAADVIIYDNLANPELLYDKKASCECIYVGKKSADHTLTQDKINQLIVDLAKKHDCVVRLKGGDPYVFGRGREEGEALLEAGIKFEVVPGITSAIGGLAYAGIPITSRNIATSFHVITGHISDKSEPIDFEHLAKVKGTLVFLMGVKNLPKIVENLKVHGKDMKTPVAIIYKASTPEQRVYTARLESIVDLANKEKVQPPSLIVVGEVVNHRDSLKFFEDRPLFGKHVLVTRSRKKHSKMTDLLIAAGAKVTLMPGIDMVTINQDTLSDKMKLMNNYQGLIFTSGLAVEIFFDSLSEANLDMRVLANTKIMVVGNETKKVLRRYGLIADYMPVSFTNQAVVDLAGGVFKMTDKVFLPRSKKGDQDFADKLSGICQLDELHIYDTQLTTEVIKCESPVDYVTFTSSSTVHGFMNQIRQNDLLKDQLVGAKFVSIGPVTEKTLKSYGYETNLMPESYTIKDMVAVIENDNRKDQ